MALPSLSKAGATTVTFSRGYSWPRPTPGDERQLVGVSEGKQVRVATLSVPEEFIVLDFANQTALPAADYTNLSTFLRNTLVNFRAFTFTFTDTDGTTFTVRYWGGLLDFVQTSSELYQGTLTLRIE